MNTELNYKNNPLHGVSLKTLLSEMIDLYGFEILFAYLNINCFKTNPSLESSVKFLKKTDWAREKVEAFYLYQYKSLPRATDEQFLLPPRDRIIPNDQIPGLPSELSMDGANRLREKREKKAAAHGKPRGRNPYSKRDNAGSRTERNHISRKSDGVVAVDPWAKWRNLNNDQ